eukprot:TRINITY_DN5518_c0_g1_i1.p2 TRINITY_DN5518_c0_g1~~TRINITY_DN5518_c0_g1_i1.p2  ORF type:complete len:155 (+),score=45.59 TRINITY_DN5518_c0_g1_i1:103-567(+)
MEQIQEEDRADWARRMRSMFSSDDMVDISGNLKLDYFKPVERAAARKWTERERAQLQAGLVAHGVGQWKDILENFLPEWGAEDLRVQTRRLLGRQQLEPYISARYRPTDVAAIDRERSRNQQIGLGCGCWKGGQLVNDDAGRVDKLWRASFKPS